MALRLKEQRVVTYHSVRLARVMALTLSTSLAALSRQVLGHQHLRALTVTCTRVVTLVTLRLVTFPRLLQVTSNCADSNDTVCKWCAKTNIQSDQDSSGTNTSSSSEEER